MIKIISLLDSKERNRKRDFKFEFFDAIDNKKTISEFSFDLSLSQLFYGRILNNGEIGCSLSHFECINKFANSETVDWLCILEDDAIIENNFNEIYEKINCCEIKKPMIFVIGHSKLLKKNNFVRLIKYPAYHDLKITNHIFLKTDQNLCGTVAYMLNKSAANILKNQKYIFWIADDWLLIEKMGIDIYHAKYPCVYEDLSTSSSVGNEVKCHNDIKNDFIVNLWQIIKFRLLYIITKVKKKYFI